MPMSSAPLPMAARWLLQGQGMAPGLFDEQLDAVRRADRLRRLLALAALLLLAATWRLWTPQTVYPQVPLLPLSREVAAPLEAGLTLALAVALGVSGLAPPQSRLWRGALWGVAGLFALLFLLDQHRLQPWAYQFWLMAIVLAATGPRQSGVLLRLLTVSIYFYSAVSKLDYVFLHTVGQQLLDALLGGVGLAGAQFSPTTRLAAVALFPVGELLVAVGLCSLRFRRVALAASLVMHGLLLVAVGPLGLGHKPGVLLWNLFFIPNNLLLFGKRTTVAQPATWQLSTAASPPVQRFAWLAILAAVLLPSLEPWGGFDHWPAWGLYAPKADRATVYVHRAALARLPEEIQTHVDAASRDDPWLELRIDDWSLAALDAPIYPQARFQLGVASALSGRYGLGSQLRVVLASPADRWTGARHETVLTSQAALASARQAYWLNAAPGRRSLRRLSPAQ